MYRTNSKFISFMLVMVMLLSMFAGIGGSVFATDEEIEGEAVLIDTEDEIVEEEPETHEVTASESRPESVYETIVEEYEEPDEQTRIEEYLSPSEPDPVYVCGMEEHVHTEECYELFYILVCDNDDAEHVHDEDCYDIREWTVCGYDEHVHTSECEYVSHIDEDDREIYCGMEEHTHDASCVEVKDEDIYVDFLRDEIDVYEYVCGLPEHEHVDECYIEPEESGDESEEIQTLEEETIETVEDELGKIDSEDLEISENLVVVPEAIDEPLLRTANLMTSTRNIISDPSLKAFPNPFLGSSVTVDDTTINLASMQWMSFSTGEDHRAGYATLIKSTDNDFLTDMRWQVTFALYGNYDHEPGTVEILVPASIFKTKTGEEMGELVMSVPEDPETGASFAWKRVDDMIVITNTKALAGSSVHLIQGMWTSTIEGEAPQSITAAHEMADVDILDPIYENNGRSDELYAVINVLTNEGHVASLTTNSIDAVIDTIVEAADARISAYDSTTKKAMVYNSVADAQAAGMPDSLNRFASDDYVYVKWYVEGKAAGGQTYNMKATVTNSDGYDMIVLGAVGADIGTVAAAGDSSTYTFDLFDGWASTLKSAYVWTAYPKSNFEQDGTVNALTLDLTITVTGHDDGVVTTRTAEGDASMRLPIVYKLVKVWDDDNDATGHRPETLTVTISRKNTDVNNPDTYYKTWRTVALQDDGSGNWEYTWTDEGVPYSYSFNERLPSGIVETWYDTQGNKHENGWKYTKKSQTYDDATHTWTLVNTYSQGDQIYHVSTIDKSTIYPYNSSSSTTSNYDINRLSRGQSVVVPFTLRVNAAVAEWTTVQGVPSVDVTITDTNLSVNSKEVTADDIEIATVTMNAPKLYTYASSGADGDKFLRDESGLTTTIYLEGLVNGEWIRYATDVGGTITAENGASVSGKTVTLPSNVANVRLKTSLSIAVLVGTYNIGVRVKPSALVQEEIDGLFLLGDNATLPIHNEATIQYEVDGTSVYNSTDVVNAYLHGRQYRAAVSAETSMYQTGNDPISRQILLAVTTDIYQQSNLTNLQEYNFAVNEGLIPNITNGVYYDLLPKGISPILSTIRVQSGDSIGSVEVIENYKGSGRTLLVVSVDTDSHVDYASSNRYTGDSSYPSSGYFNKQSISFSCVYPWDETYVYGFNDVHNTIAFESGEDWIGNLNGWQGEADDASGANHKMTTTAVGSDAVWFVDLDEARNTPSFVYAGTVLQMNEVVVAATVDIQKHASVIENETWLKGTDGERITAEEGNMYSYRIYNRVIDDAELTNIIFYDALERYVPIETEADYGDDQWHGKFMSIDVTPLQEIGIAPVVYYSTADNVDVSDQNAIDLSAWTTVCPSDRSSITAVAVDCRKDTNGDDYVAAGGTALCFYIRMLAPDGIEGAFAEVGYDDPDNNAHAYNNAYIGATMQVYGFTEDKFTPSSYTKVGIIPRDLTINKMWNDDENRDGIRPNTVTVHLYANGVDTGRSVELTSEDGWETVFKHVPKYDNEGNLYRYTFVEEGATGYTSKASVSGKEVTLVNTHEPEKIAIPLEKIWDDEDADPSVYVRPSSVEMRLYADGVFTGTKVTIRQNDDGLWIGEFTGLNKYRDQGVEIEYYVEEVQPTEDFIVTYSGEYHNIVTNTYYPFGDLKVSKTVVDGTARALETEFVFTLELESAYGDPVTSEFDYTIGERTGKIRNGDSFRLKNGETIEIKDIPSKTNYTVTETKAAGFTITSSDGNTGTIRAGQASEAEFVNTYATKGQFVPSAEKTLNGRDLEKFQFRFYVWNEDETKIRTATNAADGTVRFNAIKFTGDDDGVTFRYLVTEEDRGASGYTYDKTEFLILITPHDQGNGTMVMDTEIYNMGSVFDGWTYEEKLDEANGVLVEKINFQNQYHATGDANLRAWKTLKGRDLQEDEFQFVLTPWGTTGTTIVEHNNEDGSIAFDGVSFDETDIGKTYYYVVAEDDRYHPDVAVVYDDSIFGYAVTIYDNGDGTLTCEQTFFDAASAMTTCPECSGSGIVVVEEVEEICSNCNGIGAVASDAYFMECEHCSGTGVEPAAEDACEVCGGEGRLLDPEHLPTAVADLPVFVNTMAPGVLKVTKYVTEDSAEQAEGQEFHFKVRLIGEDIEDGDIEFTLEQASSVTVRYILKFDPNTENGGTGSTVVEYYSDATGYEVTLPDAELDLGFIPQDEDAAFFHWTTNADDTGTVYQAGDTITLDESMTLYAVWGQ